MSHMILQAQEHRGVLSQWCPEILHLKSNTWTSLWFEFDPVCGAPASAIDLPLLSSSNAISLVFKPTSIFLKINNQTTLVLKPTIFRETFLVITATISCGPSNAANSLSWQVDNLTCFTWVRTIALVNTCPICESFFALSTKYYFSQLDGFLRCCSKTPSGESDVSCWPQISTTGFSGNLGPM